MKKIYKAVLISIKEEVLKALPTPISEQNLSIRKDFTDLYEVYVTPTILPDYYSVRNTKRIFKMYDSTILHSTKSIARHPMGLLVYNGNLAINSSSFEKILEYDDKCQDLGIPKIIDKNIEQSQALVAEYLIKPLKEERKKRVHKK